MSKVFEKISDFDNVMFENLWAGFVCKCENVNGTPLIIASKNYDKENDVYRDEILFEGNEAIDMLDFVLSNYYENEDTTIEDGFSEYLQHYFHGLPPYEYDPETDTNSEDSDNLNLDDIPLPVMYRIALKNLKHQEKVIDNLKSEVAEWKEKAERYSVKAYDESNLNFTQKVMRMVRICTKLLRI